MVAIRCARLVTYSEISVIEKEILLFGKADKSMAMLFSAAFWSNKMFTLSHKIDNFPFITISENMEYYIFGTMVPVNKTHADMWTFREIYRSAFRRGLNGLSPY